MIRGCVGFSYIHRWPFIGHMLLVRGKECISVPLPYPLYLIMARLWKSKKYPGKFLFDKPSWERQLERAKRLSL